MIARVRLVFYVYALFDWHGIVRYIGKGKENRWLDHDKNVKSRNQIKNKFIRSTLRVLGEIPKIKIHQGLSEATALQFEVALIKAIGRLDLGTGPLTNMSDGGNGGDFGEAIRKTKANWTPEERAAHGKTYSKALKDSWDGFSSDVRASKVEVFLLTTRAALEHRRRTNPEFQIEVARKISQGHAKRTPKQISEAVAKQLEAHPPEARSVCATKWHATRSPEERSQTIYKGWQNLTAQERSYRARGPNFDHNKRSEQVKSQQANLTPKQRKARTLRAINLAKGTRWITNGTTNKRLKKIQRLPTGWRFGKVPKPPK